MHIHLRSKTAALATGVALIAVPAVASAAGQQPTSTPPGYNGSSNPGTQYQPASTPPSYDGSNNPGAENQPAPNYDGSNNPGTAHVPTNSQARALGVKECQQYKTNFKSNRSAFGRCISAVAMSLRSDKTPAQACKDKRLSRTRHDGQARSDFKACVLAAAKAQKAESQDDSQG